MILCGSQPRVSPSGSNGFHKRSAALPLVVLRRRLLASTTALRIPVASAALALGVALSGEAQAQTTVNPVQNTTYTIKPASNPITFGSATNIDTSAQPFPFAYAVIGGGGINWNVTVLGGARISGSLGGIYVRTQGTVTNSGQITAATTGIFAGAGVVSVINQASGTITGTNLGVVGNTGSSVVNSGTIQGGVVGVELAAGSVVNSGTINGSTNAGLYLFNGATVTNQAGGTISGQFGVRIVGGSGSVTNAGTITGTGGTSVLFVGSGSNTLILQTGSTLNGNAVGATAGGATNALILQGTGTANNNFLNFTTLDVQASSLWALNGVSSIGATTVDSGTLVVGDASHPGAALTSPVTVNAGGALAGQGTVIGNVAVLSGGAIAPGAASPFTTLNVTGNASFGSGSLYQVNINGSTGQSDKLALSGTATLTGGSVQAMFSGSLVKGSRFDPARRRRAWRHQLCRGRQQSSKLRLQPELQPDRRIPQRHLGAAWYWGRAQPQPAECRRCHQ